MSIIKHKIKKIKDYLKLSALTIPNYQRPYKWKNKHVDQLIEDIQRFKNQKNVPYRIGTVVICKEKNGNGELQIVDGQQRTVTFLLLFLAIYKHTKKDINSQELLSILDSINSNIIKTGLDLEFTNTTSKRNIKLNYLTIERKIDEIDESFIDFFLNNCEVTFFVIDDISEAFQFFDAQNARGKDLEPHDLLKAFHLRELSDSNEELSQTEVEDLVSVWENMETKDLASLFADFLFRVRGWSKGNSSRYFLKRHTNMFKGLNLSKIDNYPYIDIFKLVDKQLKENPAHQFPFQLDQTIINGKYFFQMITHYKKVFEELAVTKDKLSDRAKTIIDTLDSDAYTGKNRTGDKYVRMLFNSAILYYIDKFGKKDLSKAIEKIFIWSYSLRLRYQSLQLASVDNYVCDENNLFKKIKEAIHAKDLHSISLPNIETIQATKVTAISDLFITMKYHNNVK